MVQTTEDGPAEVDLVHRRTGPADEGVADEYRRYDNDVHLVARPDVGVVRHEDVTRIDPGVV